VRAGADLRFLGREPASDVQVSHLYTRAHLAAAASTVAARLPSQSQVVSAFLSVLIYAARKQRLV